MVTACIPDLTPAPLFGARLKGRDKMTRAPVISTDPPIDLVQELRLRRWARENYVPAEYRDTAWDACVLDEMHRRDEELLTADEYGEMARRVVPLVSEHAPALRGPHRELVRTQVLARVPWVE